MALDILPGVEVGLAVFLAQAISAEEKEQGDTNPAGKRKDVPQRWRAKDIVDKGICNILWIRCFVARYNHHVTHKVVNHDDEYAEAFDILALFFCQVHRCWICTARFRNERRCFAVMNIIAIYGWWVVSLRVAQNSSRFAQCKSNAFLHTVQLFGPWWSILHLHHVVGPKNTKKMRINREMALHFCLDICPSLIKSVILQFIMDATRARMRTETFGTYNR